MKKILLLVAVLMLVAAPAFAQEIGIIGGGFGHAEGSFKLFPGSSGSIVAGDQGYATAAIISPSNIGTFTNFGDGTFTLTGGPGTTISGNILTVLDDRTDDEMGNTTDLLAISGGAIGTSTFKTFGSVVGSTTGCGIVTGSFDGIAGAGFEAGFDPS